MDPAREQHVFSELKDRPGVAGVTLKKVMIDSFMEQMADNMLKMRGFVLFFACVISIGVVYSSARIAFSERGRDLATLRVIGLTRGEVSGILLGELAVLTLVAIPVGLLIGYALCRLMAEAISTEMYRMPFVIHPATYGLATVVVLAFSNDLRPDRSPQDRSTRHGNRSQDSRMSSRNEKNSVLRKLLRLLKWLIVLGIIGGVGGLGDEAQTDRDRCRQRDPKVPCN